MAPAKVAAAPAPGTHVERSATGSTITNAGSTAAAPGNATRAHFDEMARKFAAQATGNYTVQFELVCETSSLTTAVNVGGANVWFVPFAYHNRACYRVFWGRYATQDQATAAIRDVPAAIRGPKPVVVSVPKP
jgi:septal ring-binding cell division protein DamX